MPASPIQGLQRTLGSVLRARVAGSDAAERGELIWGKPGDRWFAPTDPIWRVQEDAAMFPGGVAALLLQSLHPLAMAGVAGHSGYKSDPWGRLERTADYLALTTFGTIDDATTLIAKIRGIHARVRGKDERGRPYRADDPHLLRWVHVAETYSFLHAYQRYAPHPLTPGEADTFVRQSAMVSARLGTDGLPENLRQLHAQLDAYRFELETSEAARETAAFILREPPLPTLALPGYWLIAVGGIAVLPDWARSMLWIAASEPARRWAEGAGRLGASTVRWGLDGLGVDRTSGWRATRDATGERVAD